MLIGFGGFLGAICRAYSVNLLSRRWPQKFPLGTFTVNLVGSFLLGLILGVNILTETTNNNYIIAITVGFLGAFTTFATFCNEVIRFFKESQPKNGIIYLVLSLFGGLIFVFLGYKLGIFIS